MLGDFLPIERSFFYLYPAVRMASSIRRYPISKAGVAEHYAPWAEAEQDLHDSDEPQRTKDPLKRFA
jgi:hypothetical protein